MAAQEVIVSLLKIIKDFMILRDDQIMLAYQKFDIPPNNDLFVALAYVSGKPIGNNIYFDPVTNAEIHQVTMHELIQIDMMSFGPDARSRRAELIAALRSQKSEFIQQQNNFQLARIPGEFINAASLEETQFLNRFTMTVAATSLVRIEKYPPYYDEFENAKVTVNE